MTDQEQVRENIKNLKFAKTVTVGEVEYTLQKLPVRAALKLRQDTENDQTKFYEGLLESIVIHPKTKLDDFGYDYHIMEELMQAIVDYQFVGK